MHKGQAGGGGSATLVSGPKAARFPLWPTPRLQFTQHPTPNKKYGHVGLDALGLYYQKASNVSASRDEISKKTCFTVRKSVID